MAIDLQAATPDTTVPAAAFLFGADSQAASAPSVYAGKDFVSAMLSDLAQTWNAGGTTFTGLNINVTDTASASGSLLMNLQVGGSSKLSVSKTGVVNAASFGGTGYVSVSAFIAGSSLVLDSANQDVVLARDAAATLALRNGTNAQAFNIYGTRTDASNYRRLEQGMSTAGVAYVRPAGAGTGASGNVLHISGLPTSNPGAGILWNNVGVVAVGT